MPFKRRYFNINQSDIELGGKLTLKILNSSDLRDLVDIYIPNEYFQ